MLLGSDRQQGDCNHCRKTGAPKVVPVRAILLVGRGAASTVGVRTRRRFCHGFHGGPHETKEHYIRDHTNGSACNVEPEITVGRAEKEANHTVGHQGRDLIGNFEQENSIAIETTTKNELLSRALKTAY